MELIKKKYIIDENKNTVAVQIDIADFERIEQILEDYALGQLIKENNPAENLNLQDAKTFYGKLDKNAPSTTPVPARCARNGPLLEKKS